MDPSTLSSALEIVAPACGATLSINERVALETSLPILKSANSFDKIVFWGRIRAGTLLQCVGEQRQGKVGGSVFVATENPIALLEELYRSYL
jgi:hypothetical protein